VLKLTEIVAATVLWLHEATSVPSAVASGT
jgi:hypothetical protein